MVSSIHLRVTNPAEQVAFYCDALGMADLGAGRVGYEGAGQARLSFEAGAGRYKHHDADLYWKIALAVPDLDLACRQLASKDITTSDPHQFRDIGYLAHLTDPEGFQVELIQHTFHGEPPTQTIDSDLLGGGPTLNLLTLRASEITSVSELTEALGMTLLSVQPVEPFGFTLYFYALTSDTPPNPDLHAVENRSWVYQRPYTVLEIQHLHAADEIERRGVDEPGFVGFRLETQAAPSEQLSSRIGLLLPDDLE